MRQMTETDKAYIAGMIDGEGCITITCSRGRYFSMSVIVTGTREQHIRECREMVGIGHISFSAREGKRANQWRWVTIASDAAMVLRWVLPYLRLKDAEAEVALDFYEHMQNSPAYTSQRPMPHGVLEYRRGLMKKLKALKKNGKVFSGEKVEVEPPPATWKPAPLFGEGRAK